ncbi:hypothetical protein [Streptomyces sp. NPDC095613]|uniref:hypothetical protein n=1 Tax=Streptomyces sp. NPDC095613 TaxID=3155540 RepID=UPI00332BEDAE
MTLVEVLSARCAPQQVAAILDVAQGDGRVAPIDPLNRGECGPTIVRRLCQDTTAGIIEHRTGDEFVRGGGDAGRSGGCGAAGAGLEGRAVQDQRDAHVGRVDSAVHAAARLGS